MAGRTATRTQLCEAVYREVGMSKNESEELIKSILNRISDALTDDDAVKISSFGSFIIRHKAERVGRNPKTGEVVPVLARRVIAFRPSQVLKSRINPSNPSSTE